MNYVECFSLKISWILKIMNTESIYLSLNKLKHKLVQNYGDEFNKLILFGSVAKNIFNNDSDVDILIMMNKGSKLDSKIKEQLFDNVFDIEIEDEIPFDVKFFDKSQLKTIHGRTPFMQNILNNGVVI
jgi:predicted nucleotidyltransferase